MEILISEKSLRKLKRYDLCIDKDYGKLEIYEVIDKDGDWIKVEDVENLIKKLSDIKERMLIFKEQIQTYKNEKFDWKMLQEFFNYWSEPDQKKTKMRWEMEKTWDIRRRLLRWYNITNGKK